MANTFTNPKVVQENVTDPDTTKTWRKFRLLGGSHHGSTRLGNMVQEQAINEQGNIVSIGQPHFMAHSHTWKANEKGNDIIESDIDLVRVLNNGAPKFQYLDNEPQRMSAAEHRAEAERMEHEEALAKQGEAPEYADSKDTLSSMNVKELRKFAESEEIDVSTCNNREEILNTIRNATAKV